MAENLVALKAARWELPKVGKLAATKAVRTDPRLAG